MSLATCDIVDFLERLRRDARMPVLADATPALLARPDLREWAASRVDEILLQATTNRRGGHPRNGHIQGEST
jgi:hypothetical protein